MALRIDLPPLHDGQRSLFADERVMNRGRKTIWRCGRRFGKTTAAEILAVARAARGHKVGWFAPKYKLITPTYSRVLRLLKPAILSANRTEGMIALRTGGLIEFWTLEDENAGRSRDYDLAIIDEAGLIEKGLQETFDQAVRPTLTDRNGDALMAGTPKGISPDSFFYEASTNKLRGWVEHHKPTHANPTLSAEALATLEQEYPPLVYRQEFLAEFVDWSGQALFALENLLEDGHPLPWPTRCDAVFATLDTATKTGKEHDATGLVFWAVTAHSGTRHKLCILDWEITQIEGSLLESWLPSVYRRLSEMAKVCGARSGSLGLFIEDKASGMILLQQAQRRGWQAHAIDSKLTSVGKDERGISTSGYVYRGDVRMTAPAYDRLMNYKGTVRNHLITQVCGYRVGVKDGDDDLFDAFCYGIAVALGDTGGF